MVIKKYDQKNSRQQKRSACAYGQGYHLQQKGSREGNSNIFEYLKVIKNKDSSREKKSNNITFTED